MHQYVKLDPNIIKRKKTEFLSIASDLKEEYWGLEHFLIDLPMKWELSVGLLIGGQIKGYIICSCKDCKIVHIHHFMLASQMRGKGLGKDMLRYLEVIVLNKSLNLLTLKVHRKNHSAKRFYVTNGFTVKKNLNDYFIMIKRLEQF